MRSGAHNQLGSRGESLAAEFLVGKGYEILVRNLTFKQGEVDILAKIGETIVIVEVKTQTSARFANPVYQVNAAKQRKLRLLSEIIAAKYPDCFIRIDIVTIFWQFSDQPPTVTHLENTLC